MLFSGVCFHIFFCVMSANEPANNNKFNVYIAQFPFLAESASYKAMHTSPKTGFTPRLPYKHLKVRS